MASAPHHNEWRGAAADVHTLTASNPRCGAAVARSSGLRPFGPPIDGQAARRLSRPPVYEARSPSPGYNPPARPAWAGERATRFDPVRHVSQALEHFALPRFALHQRADGALHLREAADAAAEPALRAALADIFGPGLPLTIAPFPPGPRPPKSPPTPATCPPGG